jgi:DNA gyrase subunit A
LLLVTTKGFGKRTALTEYPTKRRGAKGVNTTSKKALESIGLIAAARVVQDSDDLTIISANGQVLRAKVKDLRMAGRATKGVKLMGVKEGDRVVSLARTANAELKKLGAIKNGDEDGSNTEPGQQIELPILDQ